MNICRGLIFNTETMEIIARPFPKFWNINDDRHPETLEKNLPTNISSITTKMDGSLGILYKWEDQNYVATRGSFASDQSLWATNWLQKNYPRLDLLKEYTLLTEIIYPENRIVVEYDFEGLIVIGAINNSTGKELSRSDLKSYCQAMNLKLVQDHKKLLNTCMSENIPNQEGYVATFDNGLKVKLKFENYCELHRILTGLNPRSIWELKKESKDDEISSWLTDPKMPSGFITWLRKWNSQLDGDYYTILTDAQRIFDRMPVFSTRKDIARYFLQSDHKYYSAILFGLLDGKDVSNTIWKLIEPKSTETFRED